MDTNTVTTLHTATRIERRLCTIWARHDTTPGLSSWLDCSTELTDIGVVLESVGADAAAVELFHAASDLAFARMVYDMQQRKEAA